MYPTVPFIGLEQHVERPATVSSTHVHSARVATSPRPNTTTAASILATPTLDHRLQRGVGSGMLGWEEESECAFEHLGLVVSHALHLLTSAEHEPWQGVVSNKSPDKVVVSLSWG
eukprot:2313318-Rhodomonas_salina.3